MRDVGPSQKLTGISSLLEQGKKNHVRAIAGFLLLIPSLSIAQAVEEIVVTGERDLSRSTSLGKMDIPVAETPFSVTVRNADFLNSVGAKTIQDGLLHVAGVNGGTYGIDSRGDWSTIRGVSPVTYIDGLQSLYGSYTGARAASYAYERIEVLKGPASVLYGQGSTGGVVNLVSKRANSAETFGEVLVQGGSYDRKVVAFDAGGALGTDGEWLYRVVAYYRDADAQVDHVDDDSVLYMPSISWRPSDATALTFLYSKQADETGTTAAFLPWQGTLLPNSNGDIPTETFISEPGWDKYDTDQDNYSVWLEQRLSDNWYLAANARVSRGTVDYNSMWANFTGQSFNRFYLPLPTNADERTVARTAYASDNFSKMSIYDVRVNGDFSTGFVDHQLVVGADHTDATSGQKRWYGTNAGGVIDLYNPVYGNIPTGFTQAARPDNSTKQMGFYLQDQMHLGPVIVNLALRRDDVETKAQFSDAFDDEEITKRLGLLYNFEMGLAPYVSYTESFEPVDDVNAAGEPFKPISGEQVEWGLKYQPSGVDLLLTLSQYAIVQKNRLTPDPINPSNSVQTGEVEIDGLEFEVKGSWASFDFLANYSTTNTEVTESNNFAEIGTSITAIPEEQYSGWVSYNFPQALTGLSISMGVRHVGESATGLENYENPDYTLYDAAIAYQLDQWRFQLNANNLTDEVHTTSCLSRGDCFYGERRYITAEARLNF